MVNRATGKGAYIVMNGNRIEVTKLTPKQSAELADSTDSANYVPASDELWQSQVIGQLGQDLDVEGYFDFATTNSQVLGLMFSQTQPIPCTVFGVKNMQYCQGSYNMSDVSTMFEVAGATTVNFTATMKSNGPITYS